MRPPAWMIKAACVDAPPSWFDAEHYTELNVMALDVCAACPVIYECALFAATEGQSGVYGGQIWQTGTPQKTPHKCPECGNWVRPRHTKKGNGTYCGRLCYQRSVARRNRERAA